MSKVDFVSEEKFYEEVPARENDLTTIPELALDETSAILAIMPPKGQRSKKAMQTVRKMYETTLQEVDGMPKWSDMTDRLAKNADNSSHDKVEIYGRALMPFQQLYRRFKEYVESYGECRSVREFQNRMTEFAELYHVRVHDLEKIRVPPKPQQPSAGVRAQAAPAPRLAAVSANMIANDDDDNDNDDNDDTKENTTEKGAKEDDTTTNTCTSKKTTSDDALVCTEQSGLAELQRQCQAEQSRLAELQLESQAEATKLRDLQQEREAQEAKLRGLQQEREAQEKGLVKLAQDHQNTLHRQRIQLDMVEANEDLIAREATRLGKELHDAKTELGAVKTENGNLRLQVQRQERELRGLRLELQQCYSAQKEAQTATMHAEGEAERLIRSLEQQVQSLEQQVQQGQQRISTLQADVAQLVEMASLRVL